MTTYPTTDLPVLHVTEASRNEAKYRGVDVLLTLEPLGPTTSVIEVAPSKDGFVVAHHYLLATQRYCKASLLHALRTAVDIAGLGARVVHNVGTYRGCAINPSELWQVGRHAPTND